jgi:hypothetical protein
MWQQNDNGEGILWEEALSYSENLELAGYTDWRLPNSKELQSIIDYSRCPDTTDSAAIDPIFQISSITNEGGEKDYPFYWTSTTHIGYPNQGDRAVYIAFGRALGYMNGYWMDVHGAGAQRSDPKTGDPDDYPYGHGPQGDTIRIYNYVRCVRVNFSDNQPPEKPEPPKGEINGKTGEEYVYYASTTDPEGDNISYLFDWGNGMTSFIMGPYESGVECNASNIWFEKGYYEVKVKAIDEFGTESDWSNPLSVSMPKNKAVNTPFLTFLENHPHLFLLLRQILGL